MMIMVMIIIAGINIVLNVCYHILENYDKEPELDGNSKTHTRFEYLPQCPFNYQKKLTMHKETYGNDKKFNWSSCCKSKLTIKTLESVRFYVDYKNVDHYYSSEIHEKMMYQLGELCDRSNQIIIFCQICGMWFHSNKCFLWTKCNHEYCWHCAEEHIETELCDPYTNESIEAVTYDLINATPTIPTCKIGDCGEMLANKMH